VEERAKDQVAFSFGDNVAWVVKEEDVTPYVQKIQRCARLMTEWTEVNPVKFDIDKTDTMLFSK
jgi:hypothetical protein